MELFLTSQASKVLGDVCKRLPKSPSDYSVAFIPTASNVYENPWWVKEDRVKLEELGFNITDVDIAGKSTEDLKQVFSGIDIIFVAGGNTFYLLEQFKESGLDKLLPQLLEAGVMYIGSSAGSVVVAPDIEPAKFFDEREKSNLDTTLALGLVNFVPLPHQGGMNKELNEKVLNEYRSWKYKLEPLTDQQYFHIKGTNQELIEVEGG